MSKNTLHEKVYQFMESYRATHPNFYYWFRKNDRSNKKTGETKFDNGIWFQGTDKYAFVGLYARGGGSNMTRSFGIVFYESENGLAGHLEVVHNEEKDPTVLNFYQKAMDSIGGFKENGKTKFCKLFPGNNFLQSVTDFLNNEKPGIDQLAKEMGLNHMFISKEKFEQLHNNILKKMMSLPLTKSNDDTKYWIYAPGESANKWEEFYKDGVMALGWDTLGDLKRFNDKEEIVQELQKLQNTTSSKKNDATANWEFANVMSVGDIVIVKKGITELIGYGKVSSDYFYEDERPLYKSCRKVEWLKKGNWDTTFKMITKTLTDITKYPSERSGHDKYYEFLLAIMNGEINNNNNSMTFPLNRILYGPPGTGKTYNTLLLAAQVIEESTIDDYSLAKDIFNQHLGDRIEFITFHQNYSYEDFIQGLRPDVDNGTELTFERKDGVFKRIADRALRNLRDSDKGSTGKKLFEDVFSEFVNPLLEGDAVALEIQMKQKPFRITDITGKSIAFEKPSGGTGHTLSISTLKRMYEAESIGDIQGLSVYYEPLLNKLLSLGKQTNTHPKAKKQNYVIIIDEINRANISRVFGELITLIEPDKRSHGAIPLRCTLPSGEEFIVPSNLHIIGTMNTADKSIALLDIALRRRFEFEPMYPLYEIEGQVIHNEDVLRKINEKIIELKGYDFQIGHAYFMGVNDDLVERMNKKVIPLLLEYFMNDEKEVKEILKHAGLQVDPITWPLRIIDEL